VDARHKAGHDDSEMAQSSSIDRAKAELRATAQALRDALPADERRAAAESIGARKFPLAITPRTIISGFMPLKSEINPLPLMQKLAEAGARLALPAIAGRGKPLIMRAWEFGAPLDRGQWGIREPKADAPEVDPDILLVPLLAFDRGGFRIGYGAGYYDMTIHRLRERKPITAVGIAFAAQEVPKIPTTPRDERLDLVLTEREVIDLRGV
jgi:5-formyltetrahydrofolate cyclo-ligase